MSQPELVKVLAVDDHAETLVALRSVLADIGAEIVECSSGEDALRELLREEFALVLLDIGLPGIDGFETAQAIRARGVSRELPIIFLTGRRTEEIHVAKGYDLGAVDYILKPAPPEILRAKVSFFVDLYRERKMPRRVLEAATEGLMALDEQGTVLSMNTAAREMVGSCPSRLPFSWPMEPWFRSTEDKELLLGTDDPVRRALGGDVLSGEIFLLASGDASESDRFVRVSSVLSGESDASKATVIVMEDVTREETTRKEVEHRRRLDALGQLTGGIAHDFNNILATVLSALEFLAEEPLNELATRMVNNGLRATKRGQELTGRFLAFGAPQAGATQVIDVCESLDGVLALARPSVEPSLDISVALPEGVSEVDGTLSVECDPSQFENAILNLVLNARSAIALSGKGDKIAMSARLLEPGSGSPVDGASETGCFVEISVVDNGPGMSEEVRQRAMEPYFSTKSPDVGSGLGLSIVYGFVLQVGGELEVQSALGEGTSVIMRLPRSAIRSRTAETPEEAVVKGKGECILLVEDESALRENLRLTLEGLGYSLLEARNGTEAVNLLASGKRVDLLLTDIVMPGEVDGFKLVRIALEQNPRLPVVYLSGYSDSPADAAKVESAQFLTKPATRVELSAAVSKALSGA